MASPLFRPRTNHTCHQKPNLFCETVLLKEKIVQIRGALFYLLGSFATNADAKVGQGWCQLHQDLVLGQELIRWKKDDHQLYPILYYILYYLKSELWPPQPLSRKRMCTPPNQRGGGTPAGEVVGESQFGRMEKKPSTALSTLWVTGSSEGFSK